MSTLHIEHPISDLGVWLQAFGRFAEARQRGGVRAFRIFQPVDDDRYIYIHLDFDNVEAAGRFKQFLETNVWSSPEASPGLAGVPLARVLVGVEAGS